MHKEDQQGGHLKDFFLGTNKCAHQIHEYNNTQWDHKHTKVSGMNNQATPSPPGMARYEEAPVNEELRDFILNHKNMLSVD